MIMGSLEMRRMGGDEAGGEWRVEANDASAEAS